MEKVCFLKHMDHSVCDVTPSAKCAKKCSFYIDTEEAEAKKAEYSVYQEAELKKLEEKKKTHTCLLQYLDGTFRPLFSDKEDDKSFNVNACPDTYHQGCSCSFNVTVEVAHKKFEEIKEYLHNEKYLSRKVKK